MKQSRRYPYSNYISSCILYEIIDTHLLLLFLSEGSIIVDVAIIFPKETPIDDTGSSLFTFLKDNLPGFTSITIVVITDTDLINTLLDQLPVKTTESLEGTTTVDSSFSPSPEDSSVALVTRFITDAFDSSSESTTDQLFQETSTDEPSTFSISTGGPISTNDVLSSITISTTKEFSQQPSTDGITRLPAQESTTQESTTQESTTQ